MALQRLSLYIAGAALAAVPVLADPLPPDASYRPLPTLPFGAVKANDEAAKPAVMQRQQTLLEQRYDLGDRPIPGQMMSGGRKPVQGGVRVKLPAGVTWDDLAAMTPKQIRERGLFPSGFLPLPHVKQASVAGLCSVCGAATWPLAQMGARLPKLPFYLRAERASLWHGLSPGVVRPTVHTLLRLGLLEAALCR